MRQPSPEMARLGLAIRSMVDSRKVAPPKAKVPVWPCSRLRMAPSGSRR